jgi:monoamine oxidase
MTMTLLQLSVVLGVTIFPTSIATAQQQYHTVIIGAGAAGLSASYTLINNGIPAQQIKIVEVSDRIGGRVMKDTTFVSEFPIDLGASFVNYYEQVERILGDDVILEAPANTGLPTFYDYTYWDFFNDYIAPKDRSVIEFNCKVVSVDYAVEASPVETICEDGRTFLSQNVVVTVPLPILKDDDIDFVPPLPTSMTKDHPGEMWQGIKIFLEFQIDFFNGFCLDALGPCLNSLGENLFWDYTSANPPTANGHTIMGAFILGDQSEPYIDMNDEDILSSFVELLDDEFDGLASTHYVRGFVRNWSKDPHFRGTLSSCGYDCDGNPSGAQNINGKVWIAGEAFPIDGENGWVDAGAFSGDDAAKQILRIKEGVLISDGTTLWERVRQDLIFGGGNVEPAVTPAPTFAPPTATPSVNPTGPIIATTSPPTIAPKPDALWPTRFIFPSRDDLMISNGGTVGGAGRGVVNRRNPGGGDDDGGRRIMTAETERRNSNDNDTKLLRG